MALLGERLSPRFRKLAAGYLVAGPLVKLAQQRWTTSREQLVYTVSVGGTDNIYPEIQDWLLQQIPPARRRSLSARTTSTHDDTARAVPTNKYDAPAPPKDVLTLRYDGSRSQTLQLRGHKIKVNVERPEWRKDNGDEPSPQWAARLEKIIFTATSMSGRDAILAFLEEVARNNVTRPPRLFIADQWGTWNRSEGTITRTLDSVVLRSGLREDLVADLTAFLGDEAAYANLGFPYHRGYLFHGPPGCGKTSLAKALAGWFNMDVYYVPLPAIPNDGQLLSLMQRVSPRTMLLLEDVDAVRASHDREQVVQNTETGGVSLSGLLNALDGVITPHGLVLVMTTNKREVLDPALVRPGRVDRHVEFALLDQEHLRRLVGHFLPGHEAGLPSLKDRQVSPAQVLEAIKANLRDPVAARMAIEHLVLEPSL